MHFDSVVNRLTGSISRALLKARAKRRFQILRSLSNRESTLLKIVASAIAANEAVLLIAPISGTKLIKLPSKDIFIILNGCNVIISNHKFYYDIDISTNLEKFLSERFVKKMEHMHFSMQREMVSGLNDGLGDLVNKIQQL